MAAAEVKLRGKGRRDVLAADGGVIEKGAPGDILTDPLFWPVDVWAVKVPVPELKSPITGMSCFRG